MSAITSAASPAALSLLESVSATRRPKELAVFVIGMMLGAAVAGYGASRSAFGGASEIFGLALALLGLALMFIAYATVSARFTDEACRGEARSMLDALVAATIALPKAVIVALLFLVLFLLLLIPAALLMLLFQIPGIGPALEFILFPLIAALLGAMLYALLFLAAPLGICALTQGRSVFGTVAFVLAGLRLRLMDIVLKGLLIALIAAAVFGVLALIAGLGLSVTTGIKAAVQFQSGPSLDSFGSGGNNDSFGSDEEAGGLEASLFLANSAMAFLGPFASVAKAGAILFGLVGVISFLVFVQGWSLIYAELDRSLDPAKEEALLQAGYAQAKVKARQMQDMAQQKAKEMQAQAQDKAREYRAQAAARHAAPAAPAAMTDTQAFCAACKAPLSGGESFCGNCGAAVSAD